MKISEALTRIDGLKPNTFGDDEKIEWLSRMDARIHGEILMTHEHEPEEETFAGYSAATDDDTELLAKHPYDSLYIYYMESQIDYYNGEMAKFNNSAAMFNSAYGDYANYINRTKMPLGKAEMRYF